MDRVMRLCGVRPIKELEADAGYDVAGEEETKAEEGAVEDHVRYRLVASDREPAYMEGFGADVMLETPQEDGSVSTSLVGSLGVIHPSVLPNFNLTLPVASVELNLQLLV